MKNKRALHKIMIFLLTTLFTFSVAGCSEAAESVTQPENHQVLPTEQASAEPTENAAPVPQPRQLSSEDLEQLTNSLDYTENGFFLSTYSRPEEIDWHMVCYDGAGISVELTPEQYAEYVNFCGEPETSLTAFSADALASLVREKTHTEYTSARNPLSYEWHFLSESQLYVHNHGDVIFTPIVFTGGYVVNDKEYHLYYDREEPFVITAIIQDGNWQYIANLPASWNPPVTLLTIDYVETREEAEKQGAKEFIEIEMLPSDEPNGLCWAVITAQEDGVRYFIDRSNRDTIMESMEILSIPDIALTSGTLDKGEKAAIWVNQPWHPSIRLSAAKDVYYGEFWFGADNYLHFENTVPRYVTGHDLDSEGRGCHPANTAELEKFLTNGEWGYYNKDTSELLAVVKFVTDVDMDSNNVMYVYVGDMSYSITLNYGHLDTAENESPDLLLLKKYDTPYEDWSILPDWYDSNTLGDYLVSAEQLDRKQALTLTQANNGDGILEYLLPGVDENTHEFTLYRYIGTVPPAQP